MTDQNGLYYMRARYYDPQIKRFVNRDVVRGNITEGQSLNRYAYVNGNPISYIDPFGLNRDGDGGNYGYKELVSLTLEVIPWVSTAKGALQLMTGKDLITGEAVSRWGELLGLGASLVPGGKLGTKVALEAGGDIANTAKEL